MNIVKEYIPSIGNCKVYGDKIVIHKSDLEKAVKILKSDPDPFDREYFIAGKISLIEDIIYAIKMGMKNIREKQS